MTKNKRLLKPAYFVGVLLSFLVAFAAWGLSSPVGSSPDDDFHLTSIWCSSLDTTLCRSSSDVSHREVNSSLLESSCFAYQSEKSAVCQSEQEVFSTSHLVHSDRGNFSGLYPPVYYSTMHLFAGENVEISTLMMRAFNVILFVLLGGILIVLLNSRQQSILFLAGLVTLVPLGMFLIPSTNPSSWAITGIAFAILSICAYFTEPYGRKKLAFGALFLIGVVIASGARGDAGAYLIALSGVALLMFWKWGNWKELLLPAIGVLFAGFMFLSTKQSNVTTAGLSLPAGDGGESIVRSAFSVFGFNVLQLPELWAGNFGFVGLGWLDTRLPAITWVAALCVFCAVVFARIRGLSAREYSGIALLGVMLIAVPMYVLQISSSHVGENIQPRYIYPLLIGATVIALFVGNSSKAFLGRAQTMVIFVSISLANSFALYTNMSRYIQGQGWGTNWNLNAAAQTGWWWQVGPSPMVVWILGSLSFAIAFSSVLTAQLQKSRLSDSLH